MIDLDDLEQISNLDKENVLGSIQRLGEQISQAWSEVNELKTPDSCSLAENVVIIGMGGSALGGRIVDSLVYDRVRVPIETLTEFVLPNYTDKNTLVIVSSYSGNTEETMSAASEALAKGAQIFGITTGGKLKVFLEENNLPGYIFTPSNNPSEQPRMALGYSVSSILALLSKCQFIHLTDDEINQAVSNLNSLSQEFDIRSPEEVNIAKKLAKKLKGKIPVLIASEHLVGAGHAVKNQFNETAKTFSTLFDLPELNHHLMEGLRNPAEAKQFLQFLFVESLLYSSEVQKRYPLTKEVVEKNEVGYSSYVLKSSKKLDQIFELLCLGSFLSFYLAMLYGIDPQPIPWVDYFKKELSKA